MSRTILIRTLLLLSLATPALAGELRPYEHPDIDLEFSAEEGWTLVTRPRDGAHERIDPAGEIHVLMWLTTTEQDAEGYLRKMADMKGVTPAAPVRRSLRQGREAWTLEGAARIEGSLSRTVLAVIPSGRSREHPSEHNLYIVQIWCAERDHPRLAARMEAILTSVRVGDRLFVGGCAHRLYPETMESPPDLPSPFMTPDGETYVTVLTRDGRYALVSVTVENGAPNDYGRGKWAKGRQLEADAADFPTLARTGLHAREELDRTSTITGRPVAEITEDARPGRSSTAGFVAGDESLMSVIRGDNRLVRELGLTHPDLARPLFQVLNLLLRDLELHRRGRVPRYHIDALFLDDREIEIEARASKGWQDSIFDDGVRGYWSIRLRREPTRQEKAYLSEHYPHLTEAELADLTERLTSIHTGEMVPFYITRYGFYEGHTDYRADPIAIASLFGLRGLEEIDTAVGGDLLERLTRHYPPE